MKQILTLVPILVLLIGCATNRPMFNHSQQSDSAILEAAFPNIGKLLAANGAAIHFVEVDGRLVKQSALTGHTRKLAIPPGARTITLGIKSGAVNLSAGQFTLSLDAKPGGKYQFTAEVVGMDYDVFVWDVTNGDESKSLVKKERTQIRKTDRIQVMPAPATR